MSPVRPEHKAFRAVPVSPVRPVLRVLKVSQARLDRLALRDQPAHKV